MVGLTIAMADEFTGTIKKIDGAKLTVAQKAKKGEVGKEVTLDATGAKVVKGAFNKDTKKVEAGDPLEGGLKNEAVKEGAVARFVTDGDKCTEIRILAGKKK
jgi:hypothetical protein